MKRPLLIAILLLIALSAAPACTIKERPEPATNRAEMALDRVSADWRQLIDLFVC